MSESQQEQQIPNLDLPEFHTMELWDTELLLWNVYKGIKNGITKDNKQQETTENNCGFEGNQMEIKTTAEIKYSVYGWSSRLDKWRENLVSWKTDLRKSPRVWHRQTRQM